MADMKIDTMTLETDEDLVPLLTGDVVLIGTVVVKPIEMIAIGTVVIVDKYLCNGGVRRDKNCAVRALSYTPIRCA